MPAAAVSQSLTRTGAATALGDPWPYATRPQLLAALIEMLTPRQIDDRAFVALFENPFLQGVVDSCWDDVKVLLTAGIDLNGKSLTRLKCDVERRLREYITRLEAADSAADSAVDEAATDIKQRADAAHAALLEEARKFGYRPAGLLGELIEERQENQLDLDALSKENAELRERVERFGRKHARWVRRLGKRG